MPLSPFLAMLFSDSMEHEITLRTAEDLVLPQVTPDIRRRQVEIKRIIPDLELNQMTIDYALGMLGGIDPGTAAFLVVADGMRDNGEKLAKEFRLALIVLPPEIMESIWCWALVSAKGTVYSRVAA
jgi:hypothetical protein